MNMFIISCCCYNCTRTILVQRLSLRDHELLCHGENSICDQWDYYDPIYINNTYFAKIPKYLKETNMPLNGSDSL